VKQDGHAVEHASEKLRADRDVMLEAVKHRGMALEFASEALRADRDVVLKAVKQDREALQFASDELKEELKQMVDEKSTKAEVLESVKPDGEASDDIVFETMRYLAWVRH